MDGQRRDTNPGSTGSLAARQQIGISFSSVQIGQGIASDPIGFIESGCYIRDLCENFVAVPVTAPVRLSRPVATDACRPDFNCLISRSYDFDTRDAAPGSYLTPSLPSPAGAGDKALPNFQGKTIPEENNLATREFTLQCLVYCASSSNLAESNA